MSDETTATDAGRGEVVPAAEVAPKRRKAAAPKNRRKPVRWTAAREKIFLVELAETANVAGSARKAKLTETTVYRRQQGDPDFAARWAAALREGFLKLESLMLARALGGTTRDVWYGGKKVGAVREFDDRIGLALLNHHRAAVTGSREPPVAPIPIEEARARFRERLAEMNRRMGGAG